MNKLFLLGLSLSIGLFLSSCAGQGGNANPATTGGVGTAPLTTPGNTGPADGALPGSGIGTSDVATAHGPAVGGGASTGGHGGGR